MSQLMLADNLMLPIEAVTETFAILGKRGKGKTNTAVVLVEELIGAGLPTVVIDPTGVWWGLRSSADGKRAGLPVVIFGGEHGDLPLEATAGILVADTVVDHRHPVVIDLSGLSKTSGRRFVTEFLERLYHRNREVLHIAIDEADLFAPQRVGADTARMLGAMDDIVRRGRAHGIGVTLITQRPAVINKDVLSQAEVLVALGMTGPRDVAAIDEWVRLHADEDDARQVKASLASLPVGTAWVWSPGWLGILRQVHVRRRRTFDSSATPKPGQKRPAAATFAPVDIAALGEQMSALVKRASEEDPKVLLARLRAAEARAERAETALTTAQAREPQTVQVPVIPLALQQALDLLNRAENQLVSELIEAARLVGNSREQITAAVAAVAAVTAAAAAAASPVAKTGTGGSPTWSKVTAAALKPGRAITSERQPTRRPPDHSEAPSGITLGKAHRAILSVLATYGSRPITSVAVLAGYSAGGGGFRNALSALRTAGLIEGRNELTITDSGRAAAGPVDPLPAGLELREHWKSQSALGRAHGLILDVLAEAYPAAVDVAEIADRAGYSADGGGFRNALSRLRTLGLVHGRGEVVLDENLADL